MQRHDLDAAALGLLAGGVEVVALHVRMGELSGVVVDALKGAYELAREGTPLAHAQLHIEEVPVMMQCQACGGQRPVRSIQQMHCVDCGAPATEIISGRELELAALESA